MNSRRVLSAQMQMKRIRRPPFFTVRYVVKNTSNEPHFPSKEPCILSNKQYILSKETYSLFKERSNPSKEPYFPLKEPCNLSKKNLDSIEKDYIEKDIYSIQEPSWCIHCKYNGAMQVPRRNDQVKFQSRWTHQIPLFHQRFLFCFHQDSLDRAC